MHWNILKLVSSTSLLLISMQTQAITPKNNWYAGIFLGPSATSSSSFDFGEPINFEGPNVSVSASSGKINYSVLGGIGGQIGYRFCNRYRVEGELFYNNNPIKQLQLYDYQMTNTYDPNFNESVPLKTFSNVENSSDSHIQGEANTGAFMLNFIYDLLTPNPNGDGFNKVAPFVGIGIGYAYVQNAMQFLRPTTEDPANDPYNNREIFSVLQKRYIYAGQIMGGLNYFIDDFTWIGIDIRYFSTGSSNVKSSYTYTSPTATNTISSSSSLFSNKTQFISANLSFSGTLNFL